MRAPEIARVLWNLCWLSQCRYACWHSWRSGKEWMGICEQTVSSSKPSWESLELRMDTIIDHLRHSVGTPKDVCLSNVTIPLVLPKFKRRLQRIKLSQKVINSFLCKVAQQSLKEANKTQTINNIKLMSASNKKYLKKQ